MTTYWVLYFYVTATTVLCCVNKGNIVYSIKPLLFNVLLVVLILFSGLRGYQVDADGSNYIDWFQEIKKTKNINLLEMKDPAFYIISYLCISLGLGVSYLFLSYSAIAVWAKFQLVKYFPYLKYSHIFIYLYFCRFYFVHDLTQIRTGVAVGLGSFALISLSRKKIALSFLLLLTAIAFHLSVILIVPFFLLILFEYRFESRLPIIVITCLALLVSIYSDYFFNIFGLNDIIRIGVYLSGEYSVQKISLISVYFLAKVFLISWLFFYRWHTLEYSDRLIISLVMTGIFLQVALMNNDALALRAAEVFSIFDLILFIIPLRFLSKNIRLFYFVYLFLIGGVFFTSSLKILMPYKSILS